MNGQGSFQNFFNSISRPAVMQALIDSPFAKDLYPMVSMLYSKDSPGLLWADLGGEAQWADIPSLEGVHRGCPFGSFLACIGLQPVLNEVAATMD